MGALWMISSKICRGALRVHPFNIIFNNHKKKKKNTFYFLLQYYNIQFN